MYLFLMVMSEQLTLKKISQLTQDFAARKWILRIISDVISMTLKSKSNHIFGVLLFLGGGGGSPKYLTKYHQENVRSVQVKYPKSFKKQ